MGLPIYVVNFDELAVLLEDGIEIRAVADTGELNNLLTGYFDRLLDYLRRLLSQRYMLLYAYFMPDGYSM